MLYYSCVLWCQITLAFSYYSDTIYNLHKITDMNVWKEHYLQQLSHNQQLEVQLKKLERKAEELKTQLKEGSQKDATVQGFEGMSDVTMRRLLKSLEKEKAETEWQLKDCEWRLDQEAAVS